MKGIIYYYSHSGNNEKLARIIQEKLGCDILEIEETKKRKTITILADSYLHRTSKLNTQTGLLGQYDYSIFISPIWGGKVAAPLRTFIEQVKSNITNFSFISICNGTEGQQEKIKDELSRITSSTPLAVCELWINNLLPETMRGKISHTFSYRIDGQDLQKLDREIVDFIKPFHRDGGINDKTL